MAIKIRRGLEADRTSVIFEEGEVLYTTDTKSFFIGDGVTAGGNQIGGTTAASLLKTTVHNATGSTLTKGQVVYLNGNTGNKPNAVLAQANSEATSSKTIGLIITNISNNANGDIATDGLISDLNTSAFVGGDLLWLSDSIAGGMTTIMPDTPNNSVFIGYVVEAHPTQGKILIHIQNGYELNELHDVKITSVQNNDGLIYDSTLGYWKNSNTVTVQGNTFNAANKLVQLDGTAKLPAVDGSQLTNLPTPATPTLASVTTAGNTTTNTITVGGLNLGTSIAVTTLNAFTLNYIIFDSITSGQGISAVFRPNGTPTGYGYNFQFQKSSTANANGLLFIGGGASAGGNTANKHVISTSSDGTALGQPLVLRVAPTSTSWVSVSDHFTIFPTGNVVIQSASSSATDAGYKLDVNGTARVQGALTVNLPTVSVDSYLKITSATANSFNTYIGTTSTNQYAWFTNIKYNGTAFVRDNTSLTAWRMNQVVGTSAAYDTFNLDHWTTTGVNSTLLTVFGWTGNVGIGTTTDAGYKLDVNGTARVKGTGTTSATSAFTVQNSASALTFQVLDNGAVYVPGVALYLNTIGGYATDRISTARLITGAGVGSMNASAALEIVSTTQGFLPPRMTTTQKNAIATPAAGLVVYDTTLSKLCVYTSAWETITSI